VARFKGALRVWCGLVALGLALAACAIGTTSGGTTGGTTAGSATPSATPAPSCATRATTTGVAWIETSDKQIHGAIGAGGAAVLSSFVYPLASVAPNYVDSGPGSVSIAPDGKHLAVLQVQIIPNSDAPRQYILFTVDTTTHVVTRVGNLGTQAELMGWADSKTLLYALSPFWPSHVATENLHFVNITTHTDTTIAGIKQVAKAEVRCSLLFWSEYTPSSGIGKELLHRYNLDAHAAIGTPVDLGTAYRLPSEFAGPDSITGGGDWDVSADGTVLVWQKLGTVTVAASGDAVIGSSQFLKGSVDGSGATVILVGLPAGATTSLASLTLSPNAARVALSSGGVLADGMLAGGAVTTHTPAGLMPVWLASGTEFLADSSSSGGNTIYTYSAGVTAGTVAHTNAFGADALP
jgi:hypothetical protein